MESDAVHSVVRKAERAVDDSIKLAKRRPLLAIFFGVLFVIWAGLWAYDHLSGIPALKEKLSKAQGDRDQARLAREAAVRERDKLEIKLAVFQAAGDRIFSNAPPDERLNLLSQRVNDIIKRLPEEHNLPASTREKLRVAFAPIRKDINIDVLKVVGGSPGWFDTAHQVHDFLRDIGFTNVTIQTDWILGGTPKGMRIVFKEPLHLTTAGAFTQLCLALNEPPKFLTGAGVSTNTVRIDFGE